jgi:hypothetical protein
VRKSILSLGGIAAAIAVVIAIYWHAEADKRSGAVDVASERISESKRTYGECGGSHIGSCPRQVMGAIFDYLTVSGRYDEAIENRNVSLAVGAASFGVGWVLSLIVGGLSRAREAGLHTKAGKAVRQSLAASVEHTANAMDKAKGRTKECPFCAEWIKPNATVCPHCRSEIGNG